MILYVAMPGNESLGAQLARIRAAVFIGVEAESQPDELAWRRLTREAPGKDVRFVCTLSQPNDQLTPLLFMAKAARDVGAAKVSLVTPYLPYGAQTRQALQAARRHFLEMLKGVFDDIITLESQEGDPPSFTQAVSITPMLGDWIAAAVPRPYVLALNDQRRDWIAEIAARAGAPCGVLSADTANEAHNRQIILVDETVTNASEHLRACASITQAGAGPPVCLYVHGLFMDDAYALLKAVCRRVVTTDSVTHPSNALFLAPSLDAAF